MSRKIAAAVATLYSLSLISGCATSASNIKPSYVSHDKHVEKSCTDLKKEYEKTSEKADALGRSLDSAATKDKALVAGGLLLAPVALVGLAFTGGGKVDQDEYAKLLGEKAAIEKAATAQQCKL